MDAAYGYMPTLETPRLRLRKLTMRDAQDIYNYSCDPQVARYVLWDAHRSIGESRSYLRYMLRKYRMGEPASWGIIERASGRLVGTIGYMDYSEDNASVEIGYSLARWLWNSGYMTEALTRVIHYTFDAMDVNRIEAQHELTNPSSGRVMEKCGMQKEGVLRQRLYNKGRYVDVALYAIVRSDPRPPLPADGAGESKAGAER